MLLPFTNRHNLPLFAPTLAFVRVTGPNSIAYFDHVPMIDIHRPLPVIVLMAIKLLIPATVTHVNANGFSSIMKSSYLNIS